MKIRVRCTIELDVDVGNVPADYDPHFDLEENHCPGTGRVGAALDEAIRRHDAAKTCWACACSGVNKIVAIDGVPVT